SASQGNGVQGYALFQNMGAAFNPSPMDLRKRTTLEDNSLLGTTSDWTSLARGPDSTNGFSGFSANTPCILQMVLQRTNSTSLFISVSWSNATTGERIVTSVTDTNATNFSFDGIAFRPQNAALTASTITFQEVTIEVVESESVERRSVERSGSHTLAR